MYGRHADSFPGCMTPAGHGPLQGFENPENDACTYVRGAPFITEFGADRTTAAAFQMRTYMDKYGITKEQCAQVAVKTSQRAAQPLRHRRGRYTVKDVLGSPLAASRDRTPDRTEVGRVCSNAFGLGKEGQEADGQARVVQGLWILSCTYFLGDRDLLKTELRNAAARPTKWRASRIEKGDRRREITEPTLSGTSLVRGTRVLQARRGARYREGTTKMEGALPVNPIGRVLANNPYVSRD